MPSKGSNWDETQMDGKVVVITGASDGLGKASAVDLAKRGAKVYMLGRNQEKTEAAAQHVASSPDVSEDMVQAMVVDLASLESIRKFAAEFKEKEPKVDVLMNNAGIMLAPQGKTEDGFELHFGTNVLGHFLLTHLLMEQLVAAAPDSRVINLSSEGHRLGKGTIQWDDIMMEKNYSAGNAYNQSKLANILFNLELSKRLKEKGVNCYAVHPGVVKTNLTQHMTSGCYACLAWCIRPFMASVSKGAQTQIRCAVDPGYSKETGNYYADCKKKQPSKAARSADDAARLWGICKELVKLQPEEENEALKID